MFYYMGKTGVMFDIEHVFIFQAARVEGVKGGRLFVAKYARRMGCLLLNCFYVRHNLKVLNRGIVQIMQVIVLVNIMT